MHHQKVLDDEFDFAGTLMGCDFHVSLVCTNATVAAELYAQLLACGDAYEQRFSRFLPTSELSRLNTHKSKIVSETFFAIFLLGKELHHQTQGVFNPLVQIAQHGYDTTFSAVHDRKHPVKHPRYSTSYNDLHIDHVARRITLHPSQQIDVGGFLKGFVAQKMAETAMLSEHVRGVVVNIGGDLCTRGKDAHDQPFLFDIQNPCAEDPITDIPLCDRSLSTSGTYKRHWRVDHKKVHHILVPTGTQNPHTDLVSASVITPHGAVSDAFATTAIILGSDKARQFLERHGAQYILIAKDGTIIKNI